MSSYPSVDLIFLHVYGNGPVAFFWKVAVYFQRLFWAAPEGCVSLFLLSNKTWICLVLWLSVSFPAQLSSQCARLSQGTVKYLISPSSRGWCHTDNVVLRLCSKAGRFLPLVLLAVLATGFCVTSRNSRKALENPWSWTNLLLKTRNTSWRQ